jgi:hypothetical protein
MPALTSAWLFKQVHAYLVYLRDANTELFLPNQFAVPTATIQAFVNVAIGTRLPSQDWWIRAYSDNQEMSTIRDLVCNPSKINSTTLNMVKYNYQAALRQLQIVIKDEMMIFNKLIQGGSSYTCLQLVPAKFYNIIFVAFHSNANGLGWEFWFLVPISGTPILSGILIPFSILKLTVFFWNSDVWRVRKLEFRFAIFGIPVIFLHRNSLRLILADLYWLQSMYNDLILMVHKLVAPLQHQTADHYHVISWHHQCKSCHWPAILDWWCNQWHWCASGK